MKLTLYHMPSACSRVTLAALKMTGAPFDVVPIPFHKGGLNDPAFRAINPAGQVPALKVGDSVLTENAAILLALAKRFPEAGILPFTGDAITDARKTAKLIFCSSQLHPIVSRIVFPARFCDYSEEAGARVREQAIAMMLDRLALVEPTLPDRTGWWVEGSFSILDIYLVWFTNRLTRIGIDLSGLPRINAHRQAVMEHPLMTWIREREAAFVVELEADGSKLPEPMRAQLAL